MLKEYETIVKVMEGGRITIPSEIRDLGNINKGSYLKIRIEKIEQPEDGNRQKPIPQKRYKKAFASKGAKND